MSSVPVAALVLTGALFAAAPTATAATKSCGTARGVGNGTAVTAVTTTSGTCVAAKTAAKAFARTRVAPKGYACDEKLSTSNGFRARVVCSRPGRRVSFRVSWRAMPLPAAPALPSVGAGS